MYLHRLHYSSMTFVNLYHQLNIFCVLMNSPANVLVAAADAAAADNENANVAMMMFAHHLSFHQIYVAYLFYVG